MRLINTQTRKFEEFFSSNVPKYAILSHTWDDYEVSFKDACLGPEHVDKSGWQKIDMMCRLASDAGLDYAWIDTCAIDKSSSAELTEAINSMYQWYQRSEVCYAFLSDLEPQGAASQARNSVEEALAKCRWFRRGWTLQELIAPSRVEFYDQTWSWRGSKVDLIDPLSRITGINPAILLHRRALDSVCVAQKLSWTTNRTTTRLEDEAYCLLGLFNVNMALLYGEGDKAFARLQGEIIKATADMSIFGWTYPRPEFEPARHFCGVLAQSPQLFARCSTFETSRLHESHEFSETNIGVKMKAVLFGDDSVAPKQYRHILSLHCYSTRSPSTIIGIRLRMCGRLRFMREDPWSLIDSRSFRVNFPLRDNYLVTKMPLSGLQLMDSRQFIQTTRAHVFKVSLPWNVTLHGAWPLGRFDHGENLFLLLGDPRLSFVAAGLEVGVGKSFPKCMFYVAGCSPDGPEPQCTLIAVDSVPRDKFDAVQTDIVTYDSDGLELLKLFLFLGFPNTSAVVRNISGTEKAMLSFNMTLEDDPTICPNKFWKITFVVTFHSIHSDPAVRHGTWNVNV